MVRGTRRVVSRQAPGQVSALFGDARASMDLRGWKQVMAMRDATDRALLTYEKDDRAAVLSFNDDRSGGVTPQVQLRPDVRCSLQHKPSGSYHRPARKSSVPGTSGSTRSDLLGRATI